MDHKSQPKSRLVSVTFARELLCLNRAGSIHNITSHWQDPEILIFCCKSTLRKIRSHAETPCIQVSFWSIRPLKGYRRKTGPREAETDSRYCCMISVCHGVMCSLQYYCTLTLHVLVFPGRGGGPPQCPAIGCKIHTTCCQYDVIGFVDDYWLLKLKFCSLNRLTGFKMFRQVIVVSA